MSSISASARDERVATNRLAQAGLLAAITSGVANAVVFIVERVALGIEFVMPFAGPGSPAAPLPLPMVVIASAMPALFGAILLALLGRFSAHPVRVFRVIAFVFTLLSLGAPFSLPIDQITQLALVSLHIVAAATITFVLTTQAVEK